MEGPGKERVGFNALLREFFKQPEYENVADEVKDSANLREDLWLDDLALLDLGEFIEKHTSVVISSWDKIETVADLRARVGAPANLFVVRGRSISLARLPPARSAVVAAQTPSASSSARSRYVLRVSDWNPSVEEFQRVLHLVPPERREKVMRYNLENDRRMHLCGRLLLRFMIHKHTGIPYGQINFAYTRGNKPVLATPLPEGCSIPNYNFNYSHDGELVCAGSEPEVIIGVDVARAHLRQNKGAEEWFRDMKRSFSASEWTLIRRGQDDREKLLRFFVFWALKESYVKATGWGMGTEFETFEFRDVSFEGRIEDNHNIKVVVEGKVQVGWNFRLYIVDDDHVVSYATGPPKDAAPTFKATFKMPNSSPLWNQSEPIEFDPEIISLHDVIKDMPPWKD